MPGWMKRSNDKTHDDGIIEKGVSGKPSVKSRYGEKGFPGSAGYKEPARRKMESDRSSLGDSAKKRYGERKIIERGVRP